jgi:hypothetical protein
MHPARDERFGLHAAAQQVLPHRERACNSEQGFGRHERDRGQVEIAKPRIANPAPAEGRAQPHEHEAGDDESGD